MKFRVSAGNHDRRWCPVSIALETGDGEKITSLRCSTDGSIMPAQAWTDPAGSPMLSWIVPLVKAGTFVDFEPVPAGESVGDAPPGDTAAQGVKLQDDGNGRLDVFLYGELFTTYNYGSEVVRPYLYPVYAEKSVGITRNWPMVPDAKGETDDHPHHKGIYTAQGEVNGVDNWGEGEHHGYQIHKRFTKVFDGPVDGGFVEELEWTDEDRTVNMTETRRIIFFAPAEGIRLCDYTVILHASRGRVVLGDTKEGGLLSVRVATSMDASGDGRIVNGFGGIQETETWGKRAPWCDYSGPVDGRTYGITMMDHPENPRHPTPWHVREYGLMTANCFGFHHFTRNPENRRDLVLEDGEFRTWNYRVYIHSGDAAAADSRGRYLDFAFPPTVEASTE